MAVVAPNVAYTLVAPEPFGGTFDRAGLQRIGAGIMDRLAEPMAMVVTGTTAEGERVAVETEARARTKTGTVYHNRYHFLFVVREGVIVELREFFDSARYVDVMQGGPSSAS